MDFACHCQKPGLASTVAPCVEKACDVADQICMSKHSPLITYPANLDSAVSKAVVSQCSAAGYPISVPPIETPASSSAGSSSASSSSSSPASATPSCSSPPTASSSSAGYSSTPAGSGSTPAGTSTPLPSKTSGGSTASTSPAFNAAGYIKGNMAGVAAVAAAAAYVL